MAKSQILCMLIIAAIFSVGVLVPMADAKECYQVHFEILCGEQYTPKCLAFCKQRFGPSTTVQCQESVFIEGPYCVCNYVC
ncbi:hypothetical protein ACJIZ3_013958 [Penstemon smallii]|uniref:Uncharacterized protein n=1 Tax=Penstemon smallii TaxID=265156 RepID=A0ABD3RI68_9LAMI